MASLRLSGRAVQDIEAIRSLGIERFGGSAAARHLAGFERLFVLLRDHPRAGALRVDLGRGLRSISHRPHVIIYRVEGDDVLIARILHQAQDVADAIHDWR